MADFGFGVLAATSSFSLGVGVRLILERKSWSGNVFIGFERVVIATEPGPRDLAFSDG
jgi:hypothetical protein